MPEFVIEFEVGVDSFHGEVNITEMIFEELFVLLVGDVPSNFFTQVVQVSFSDVQAGNYFFLKRFEFF